LERLQLALDSAEIGLWDWDLASDELWWSERQFALFGIQTGNFSRRGVQVLENIHAEDRRRIQESIDKATNSLESFNEEFRVVHPDGTVRWLAGRAQPYYPPESRSLRMIGVNFDITERKDAELEREKYIHLENLAQMHRLHMAGEIAALLSHQLNQPLTAIRSFAEAGLARLRRAEHDPARMQQTLEDVVAQSERAAGSIRELRKFLARQPQEKLSADYNATVRSACRLMEVLARGRGINLKLELEEPLCAQPKPTMQP
jgi:PAS domain S-box-containing protein